MKHQLLYDIYTRRLAGELDPARIPRHIGIILDGNRRWARAEGTETANGHRRGAQKIDEVLSWCQEFGVEVVTLWMLSIDNLSRSNEELEQLEVTIASAVEHLRALDRYQLRVLGKTELLSAPLQQALRAADGFAPTKGPAGRALVVNVAVAYGGRQEIVEAVRTLLLEKDAQGLSAGQIGAELTAADITSHLYTKGQPDPDLVIRTSGEQRLSGFLLWQSAHSEFYFCEAYWPDFRKIDFLRALRDYASRSRRMGK